MYRIGVLTVEFPTTLRQSLASLLLLEGQNIVLGFGYAGKTGVDLITSAPSWCTLKVDVIVATIQLPSSVPSGPPEHSIVMGAHTRPRSPGSRR